MSPSSNTKLINSPEVELLLCATSLNTSEHDLAVDQPLLSRIDWDTLFRAANNQGVLPQLYQFISSHCAEAIPPDVLNRLHDESVRNTRSNLALTALLFKVLELFQANDINSIPYKGPALAASAYGDIALRQFVDLDLILHKKDVLKAKDLLVSRGWRPEFDLIGPQEEVFLERYYDYALLKDGKLIEIHWELTEGYFNFPIKMERLWSRLRSVTITGRRVLTLAPEDSLLIICVHSSKHLWSRLGWICDVANLINSRNDLNWDEVFQHADELGSRRMLSVGLLLSIDLLGASVPERVAAEIRSDTVAMALAREFASRLFNERLTRPGIRETSRLHLRMRERQRDRIIYALRLSLGTTVGDWTAVKIPRSLFFLYYLIRPFRLLGKSVSGFLNRSFSKLIESGD